MRRNAWKRTLKQLYTDSTSCVDDHQFKNEDLLETVGQYKKKLCSHIVLKCLHLARIGSPDTFWSLHCLSRAITKWNKACDKCLARLSSGINFTSGFRQYCHVGNTASPCTFGAFQESDFIGDQADSKSMSGGMFMHLG